MNATPLHQFVPTTDEATVVMRDAIKSALCGLLGLVSETKPSRFAAMSDATTVLAAVERGEPKAAEELLGLVYDELRRLAASKMAHEAPGQTLQPTELVHEAWLRLVGAQNPAFNDRTHFFRAAAEACGVSLQTLAPRWAEWFAATLAVGQADGTLRLEFDADEWVFPKQDVVIEVNGPAVQFHLEHGDGVALDMVAHRARRRCVG